MSKETKRFRLFAGPNGSGKTTFFKEFKDQYNPGLNINADVLQNLLNRKKFINLNDFGINSSDQNFSAFHQRQRTLLQKAKNEGTPIALKFRDGLILRESGTPTAYEASFLSAFLRHECIRLGISFSSESVMSHSSKLEELKKANEAGFRTYLYYFCTDSPIVNQDRVKLRVKKGGHDVPDEKIESRYYKSLELAFDAAKLCNRAYFFDTSQEDKTIMLAEMEDGEKLITKRKRLNQWFIDYILNPLNNAE